VRILISRLSALGDVVCSVPAAVALKATFPDAHLTWVVDPRFAGIVECCPSVDEVIRANPRPWQRPTYSEPFDLALDLQGLLKSALALVHSGAPKKLGYHWQREGASLFSEKVLPDPSSFHIVDQYVDVARAAGAVVDRAEFNLHPRPEDADKVNALLAENGIVGPYVVVNAGAGWVTKRWPEKSVAEFVNAVGRPCVLIGGKAEPDRQAAEGVASAGGKFVNLVGKTGVRELVALIANASAHLGGDTGSTHIAAAVNTPAIGLYSITRPQRSCPYGQIDNCFYDPAGLDKIGVQAVVEKTQAVMR
jgi:ADP-heptose:LPS heptosyltransferase